MRIGKVYLCPACGWSLKGEGRRCDVCGAQPGPDGEILGSRLSEAELAARLRSARRAVVLARVFIPVSIIAAFIAFVLQLWAVAVLCLLAAAFCAVLNFSYGSRIKHLVAVNVVRDALGEVFDVEIYNPNRHISSSAVSGADLVRDWNESGGSDFVRGKYKGVGFEFSDIRLVDVQEITDSEGNTTTSRTTRFKGQWIVLETKKAFGHAVRLRERSQRKLSGSYKKTRSDVETENQAFNAKFEILTRDPHTAFYILTPHFMEAIAAADERAQARTYLCFREDQVHVAVDTGRDSFEVKRGADIRDIPALRARIQGEIRYIMEIVDELLQNKYLFGEVN